MSVKNLKRVGSRAVMVDLPDLSTVMNYHAALTTAPLDGQVDAIAAARTVLVTFDSPRSAARGAQALETFSPDATEKTTPREITIDVVYDGEDLEEVAEHLNMTVDELIEWHTSIEFTGAFGGFAPGFTYCVAADEHNAKDVPRRSSPRTAVRAGAVGLAGEFSAVYPRTSPGGWQLIGTTATPMWDAENTPPAAIAPGDIVRYRQVTEHPPQLPAEKPAPTQEQGAFELTDTGLLTLIEDLGRAGNGNLGVTTSGAADRAAHRAANEAVGNSSKAATLENIGGLILTARTEIAVAVTGAGEVDVDKRPVTKGHPLVLPVGATLTIAPGEGLRSYVAVRGGIAAAGELGSRSADVLSGLGPKPLRPGATLGLADQAKHPGLPVPNPQRDEKVLRCVAGPRDEWIAGGTDALTSREWQVSEASNRVGLRLQAADGTTLTRACDGELASEGIVGGAIQVPTNGEPVVFLRDHAVTGGYPVVATVVAEDLDIAAQLAPGDTVSFTIVDPDTLTETTSPKEH
ncbi:allophanate hydrolase [Corynebacterium yudongzhengii]|uniref:Allophanate hydrolase n=1 Tax=Corynebacterium yudongzhengii TaxID=2080740 RepID=A0A2U1T6J9_9CORY|nr:carboxyltransferase domain-containing protein [Corynebacterium yudongzhengii]AWB82189.1 allophanate hydrolase [Corynebacterium yudongzhengii]PWC01640.1 allophanate hydrolase [Corynebacterium yudongzhengii]